MSRNSEISFIGGAYFPPSGSVRKEHWKSMLQNLEDDIIAFRKQGKVIVLGDFNCRIALLPSAVCRNDAYYVFNRNTKDTEFRESEAFSRGKEFIDSMNSVNMIVLNGIDSGGDFTFLHPNGGSSIIDYITLSDDFFFPDCKLDVQKIDTRSGNVVTSSNLGMITKGTAILVRSYVYFTCHR